MLVTIPSNNLPKVIEKITLEETSPALLLIPGIAPLSSGLSP